MYAASAVRIGENNALLKAYEAVTDHASYWPAYVAVEGRMNEEYINGYFRESNRVRAEMNRITRALRPMLDAQYRAIRTYSTAELIERAKPSVTLDEATAAVCASLAARNDRSARFVDAMFRALDGTHLMERNAPVMEAAE